MNYSIFEILMLLCFACSWPVSIAKTLRTKKVAGKSPMFMTIIIIGYVMGVIHKIIHNNDFVMYLYIFNAVLVGFDLFLYCKYRESE